MTRTHRPARPALRGTRPRRGDAGFTLIELLVVMIIIGVLAAIAVPTFLSQRQKARDTAVRSDLRNIALEVRSYGVEKGTYPTARTLSSSGVALKTSSTVIATVVWRSDTDFCLVGTSTASGPDTSGYGSAVGVNTRLIAVSANSSAKVVTSADRGCLATAGVTLSNANGYWAEDGYHDETFSAAR